MKYKKIKNKCCLQRCKSSEIKSFPEVKTTKATYRNIKAVGSWPGVLYGLGNFHKETKNGIPLLFPVFSGIRTPAHQVANVSPPFLTPSTENECTVKNPFHFAEISFHFI